MHGKNSRSLKIKKKGLGVRTTTGQHQRLCGMHGNAAQVIRMSLVGMNLLQCVVVENTNLHIIGSSNDPIFACHKACRTYWDIANLEIFDQLLVFVVHDVYVAIV